MWSRYLPILLLASGAALFAVDGGDAHGTYPYTRDRCLLDATLVIDISGSMGIEGGVPLRIDMAKEGAKNFVDELSYSDDQSALVWFNQASAVAQNLTFNHQDTWDAIDALAATGQTNVPLGVRTGHLEAITPANRSDARDIMIVVGDGDGGGNPHGAADLAKTDGIEVFVIKVGPMASSVDFQNMASFNAAFPYYQEALTAPDIVTAFDNIIAEIPKVCVAYEVTPPYCHDGGPVVADILDLRVRVPYALASLTVDWGDMGPTDTYTGTSPPLTHTHTYSDPGAYTITMIAEDTGGNVDEKQKEIYLSGCPTPDLACVALSHPQWGKVQFNDMSLDPDDNIVSYMWDFGDSGTGTGKRPLHDYGKAGTWPVTLTITDADDNVASVTKDCVSLWNAPPVAVSPARVVAYEGEVVRFPVTGHDPDLDPVVWTWQAGGLPGTPAWGERTMEFVWPTFEGAAGEYRVSFDITDPYWSSTTTATVIEVLPVPPLPPPENGDADGDGVSDATDGCQHCNEEELGGAAASDATSDATSGGTDGATDDDSVEARESVEPPVDTDGDGHIDPVDNCVHTVNPDQADLDGDALGDVCDPDTDGDHVPDMAAHGRPLDNCVYTFNPLQEDEDGDGAGDACQGDVDADGVADGSDNCMWVPNPLQEDGDGDGTGDVCEGDETVGDQDVPPPDDGARPAGTSATASGMGWTTGLAAAVGLALLALLVLFLVRRRSSSAA